MMPRDLMFLLSTLTAVAAMRWMAVCAAYAPPGVVLLLDLARR
jgi:hypothetical protein